MGFLDVISDVTTGFYNIVTFVLDTIDSIAHIFDDIDFTILYDWLPSDIGAVITVVIGFLFILALFGLLRRLLFFLG